MNKKHIIITAIIIIVLTIMAISLTCCMSFKPIWKAELPAECNLCLNTYKMYYDSKDKSATVPAYDYCIKKLHRLSCQTEVFGVDDKGKPNPVLYEDAKLYRAYSQCLSELK
jgi:hypothetical protein